MRVCIHGECVTPEEIGEAIYSSPYHSCLTTYDMVNSDVLMIVTSLDRYYPSDMVSGLVTKMKHLNKGYYIHYVDRS
jgi:hypothetical protein